MAYNAFTYLTVANTGYVIPLGGNFATVKVTTDQGIVAQVLPAGSTPVAPIAAPTPVAGVPLPWVGIAATTTTQFGDFAVSTTGQEPDTFAYLVVWIRGSVATLTVECH